MEVYYASLGEPQPLASKFCLQGFHKLLLDLLLLVQVRELDPLPLGCHCD